MINCHSIFKIEKVNSDDEFLYKKLYNAEINSEHPIEKSIYNYIQNLIKIP